MAIVFRSEWEWTRLPAIFQQAEFYQNSSQKRVLFCHYKQPSRIEKKVTSLSKVNIQTYLYSSILWIKKTGINNNTYKRKRMHFFPFRRMLFRKRETTVLYFLKVSWDSSMSHSPMFWVEFSQYVNKSFVTHK